MSQETPTRLTAACSLQPVGKSVQHCIPRGGGFRVSRRNGGQGKWSRSPNLHVRCACRPPPCIRASRHMRESCGRRARAVDPSCAAPRKRANPRNLADAAGSRRLSACVRRARAPQRPSRRASRPTALGAFGPGFNKAKPPRATLTGRYGLAEGVVIGRHLLSFPPSACRASARLPCLRTLVTRSRCLRPNDTRMPAARQQPSCRPA